jgi:hypothetical protein
MKLVATFSNSDEANLLRAHLEGSGIAVFVRDDLTVSVDWGLSNAVGGVKVEVPDEDYNSAVELLAAFSVPMPGAKGTSRHTVKRYVELFFLVWLVTYGVLCVAFAIGTPPEKLGLWLLWLLPCAFVAGFITLILAIYDK